MTPEQTAQRIIDANPPREGMLEVFNVTPSRFKRLAAEMILANRRNREALKRSGRWRGYGRVTRWMALAEDCRRIAADQQKHPTIRAFPHGFAGPMVNS